MRNLLYIIISCWKHFVEIITYITLHTLKSNLQYTILYDIIKSYNYKHITNKTTTNNPKNKRLRRIRKT